MPAASGRELQVCRPGSREGALGTKRPILVPNWTIIRWCLDFVSDVFTNGQRFRVLAVVDDFSRERLALSSTPVKSPRTNCKSVQRSGSLTGAGVPNCT